MRKALTIEIFKTIIFVVLCFFIVYGGCLACKYQFNKEEAMKQEIQFRNYIIEHQNGVIQTQGEQIIQLEKENNDLKKIKNKTYAVASRSKTGNIFNASAYTAKDPGCSRGTATGTEVKEGRTLSVDPSVIPLGSKVKITSDFPGVSGEYIAEDVGGAIKGNRLDIFMEDREKALQFGRRDVVVEVIG